MNRKEIDKDIERNRAQRLEFVTWYARWVKSTPNSVWSMQQRELLDSVVIAANKARMNHSSTDDDLIEA